MIHEVQVPSVGESIREGVLAAWLIGDGEYVEKGAPLFELETDKASNEVPAPESGTLAHKVSAPRDVEIGQVVATIDGEGKGRADKEEDAKSEPVAEKKAPPEPPTPAPASENVPVKESSHLQASSVARKMAEQYGLDLSEVPGTGPSGRITREDVLLSMERQGRLGKPGAEDRDEETLPASSAVDRLPRLPAMPPVARPAGEVLSGSAAQSTPRSTPSPLKSTPQQQNTDVTRERMSMLRRRIAERLVSAQHNAAMLTTFNDVDMSAVMALRRTYKDTFKERHGVGLGFMSFFIRATVEALKDFPRVNAEIDGDEIVLHHRTHIGVAVSTPRGLVVPVLRDADRLRFAEVESRILDFATRAREGKIELEELHGGTFSITNGGVFGSLLSTPILNPPQSAILGMHRIEDRAVVRDGQVVARPMMYLALSYDHRIIDGREAVGFLVRIKECIENPERLLLDV